MRGIIRICLIRSSQLSRGRGPISCSPVKRILINLLKYFMFLRITISRQPLTSPGPLGASKTSFNRTEIITIIASRTRTRSCWLEFRHQSHQYKLMNYSIGIVRGLRTEKYSKTNFREPNTAMLLGDLTSCGFQCCPQYRLFTKVIAHI